MIPQVDPSLEFLNRESVAETTIFIGAPENATANQMAIIRAALKVFGEKGYIETTMLDTAQIQSEIDLNEVNENDIFNLLIQINAGDL